jgi:hypothetical protein
MSEGEWGEAGCMKIRTLNKRVHNFQRLRQLDAFVVMISDSVY